MTPMIGVVALFVLCVASLVMIFAVVVARQRGMRRITAEPMTEEQLRILRVAGADIDVTSPRGADGTFAERPFSVRVQQASRGSTSDVVTIEVSLGPSFPRAMKLTAFAERKEIVIGNFHQVREQVDLVRGAAELWFDSTEVALTMDEVFKAVFPSLRGSQRTLRDAVAWPIKSFEVVDGRLVVSRFVLNEGQAMRGAQSPVAKASLGVLRLASELKWPVEKTGSWKVDTWAHWFERAPQSSQLREQSLTVVLERYAQSPQARSLHDALIRNGGMQELSWLFESTPHQFFSELPTVRLELFLDHLIETGRYAPPALPDRAISRLSLETLTRASLGWSLRMEALVRRRVGVLARQGEDLPEEVTAAIGRMIVGADDTQRAFLIGALADHMRPARLLYTLGQITEHLTRVRFYPQFSQMLSSTMATLVVQPGLPDVWPDELEGVLISLLGVESVEARVHALRALAEVGSARALEPLRNLVSTANTLMPTALDMAAKRAYDAVLARHGTGMLPGALTILDETQSQRGELTLSKEKGGMEVVEE